MKVEELAAKCVEALNRKLKKVLLVIPGSQPRGHRVRLIRGKSRAKCPMGEIVGWEDDPPRTVAYFEAMSVLAFLAAKGLIEVRGQEGNSTGWSLTPGEEPK